MARSNLEVEFKAMVHKICELIWIMIVLTNLRTNEQGLIRLCCDNKLAINIAYNLVQHDHTNYEEVDWHFIIQKFESELIYITHISTSSQLDNILIKGLTARSFLSITSKLGMKHLFTNLRSLGKENQLYNEMYRM